MTGGAAETTKTASDMADEVRDGLRKAESAEEVTVLVQRAKALGLQHEAGMGERRLKNMQQTKSQWGTKFDSPPVHRPQAEPAKAASASPPQDTAVAEVASEGSSGVGDKKDDSAAAADPEAWQ